MINLLNFIVRTIIRPIPFFFTYGDLPLEQHLKAIDENVARKFTRINANTAVPDEVRLSTPERYSCTTPVTPGTNIEKQGRISVSYLAGNATDHYESFLLSVATELLASGPNSPMYQSLIESKLGTGYAPCTGYNVHSRESFLSFGLAGISPESAPKVESLIFETLQQVCKDGFPQERIDALLHQIELSQNHVTRNFGLTVASGIMNLWIHGGDPAQVLKVNEKIETFKSDMKKDPKVLQNILRKYTLLNPHLVILSSTADPKYVEAELKSESNFIERISNSLTLEERKKIVTESLELKARQESVSDLSCLPTLQLSDISKQGKYAKIAQQIIAGKSVQFCPQPTNSLTYFKALFPLSSVPNHLKPYLPLFCSVLFAMGTKEMDYRALDQTIENYTGGISTGPMLVYHHTVAGQYEAYLSLKSRALQRNVLKMFSIITSVLTGAEFRNLDRLQILLHQIVSSMEEDVVSDGHKYAISYANATQSPQKQLSEAWNGISQLKLLQKYAHSGKSLEELASHLSEISQIVFGSSNPRFSINCEEKDFELCRQGLQEIISNLPDSKFQKVEEKFHLETEHQQGKYLFFPTPGSVNFVAKTLPSVPYLHPHSPALTILTKLVSSCYLHTEVREKGGAYGSGLSSSSALAFYSYRDPRLHETIEIFSKANEWIHSDKFTDDDLREAKLSIFSDIDAPCTPSDHGSIFFTNGITSEMREKRRSKLLSLTRADMHDAAVHLLQPGSIVVFGSESQTSTISSDNNWKVMAPLE